MASKTKNYIPGLDIKASLISKHAEEKNETVDGEDDQKLVEYKLTPIKKETPPTIVRFGYDNKSQDHVSLVSYRKIKKEDDFSGDLVRESVVVNSLKHENILEFYGILYGTSIEKLHLIFEPFHCFLSQLLCEHHDVLDPLVIKCLISQLFMGLKYMHDKSIVHRDITSKNLVLTEKGVLKISNFRSARKLGCLAKEILTAEFCYQPLDMLLGSKTFSKATDIWSATCIFAELLLKRKLFESTKKSEIFKEIFQILGFPGVNIWPEFINLPYYKYLDPRQYHQTNFLGKYFEDDQSFDLLCGGFIYNPMSRMSADECLKHPYFENLEAINKKSIGVIVAGKIFQFPVKY